MNIFTWLGGDRKRDLETCRKVLHVFICKFHSQASSWRTYKVLHFIGYLSPSGVVWYTSSMCKGCTAFVWIIMHDNYYGYASERQTDAPICLNHRTLLHRAGGDDLCWPHHCLPRLLGAPGLAALAALQPSLNQPAALYEATLLQLLASISSAGEWEAIRSAPT